MGGAGIGGGLQRAWSWARYENSSRVAGRTRVLLSGDARIFLLFTNSNESSWSCRGNALSHPREFVFVEKRISWAERTFICRTAEFCYRTEQQGSPRWDGCLSLSGNTVLE